MIDVPTTVKEDATDCHQPIALLMNNLPGFANIKLKLLRFIAIIFFKWFGPGKDQRPQRRHPLHRNPCRHTNMQRIAVVRDPGGLRLSAILP